MKRKPLQDYERLLQTCYGRPNARRGRRAGSRHAASASVTARGFDDGRAAIAAPPPDVAGRHGGKAEGGPAAGLADEYDCAAHNDRFDAARYEDEPGPREAGPAHPQPAPQDEAPNAGAYAEPPAAPVDASAQAAPGFRGSPPAPSSPPPPPQSATPAAVAASLPPRPTGGGGGARSASAAFTQGQLKHLVKNEEMLSDLQSILNGGGSAPPPPKPTPPPPATSRAASQPSEPPPAPHEQPNEHAIFDRISQNMRYATAYDLGSVELERHFDALERMEASRQQALHRRTVRATPVAAPPSPYATPRPAQRPGYARAAQADAGVDAGADAAPPGPGAYGPPQYAPLATQHANDPGWPPRPPATAITPYSSAAREQRFGQLNYEADPSTEGGDGIRFLDDWPQRNIVDVRIPQLDGKLSGGRLEHGQLVGTGNIRRGVIPFNRRGQQALVQLWQDWQDAGLLDRIITFNGGYVPRFIRGTENRNPRPLSNHAWGTAFDINRVWNLLGAQPALVGEVGCVRELVEIANRNGFFWGGHFGGGRVDGMHFELGELPAATP
jgi:hypothetical protein